MSAVPRAAALLIGTALILPTAVPVQAQAELLSLKSDRYELYAPTQDDLERVRAGVQHVMKRYEDIFGTPAPDMVFVLFSTNEQARAYGADRFPGRVYQAWVADSPAPPPQIFSWPEIGALLHQPSEGGVVVTALFAPEQPLTALREGDAVVAVNGATVGGLGDLVPALRAVPADTVVVLGVERNGVVHDVSFRMPQRVPGASVPPEIIARLPRPGSVPTSVATVAHEAMHRLVGARYGRPLPPWFSEGLASFIEPEVDGTSRYWAHLRSGQLVVPIRELLDMPHPASSATPVGEVRGNTIRMVATGNPRGTMVYSQGMALLTWFAEVEGMPFVARVGDGLSAGRTLADILTEATKLPRDLDALDAAFRAWLAARDAA